MNKITQNYIEELTRDIQVRDEWITACEATIIRETNLIQEYKKTQVELRETLNLLTAKE